MAELLAAEPTYGPGVSVAANLPDRYKPVDFDFEKFSQRLQSDLPEIDQDGWNRAIVHLTHELPEHYGGFALRMNILRKSRTARFLLRVFGSKSKLIPGNYNWLEAVSDNKDVLVGVNLDMAPTGGDYEVHAHNPSRILAHEIKHASVQLTKPPNDAILEMALGEARRGIAALGLVVTGSTVGVTSVWAAPEQLKIPGIVAGMAMMFGPLILTSTGHKKSKAAAELSAQAGVEEENSAYNFVLKHGIDWEGIVRTGRAYDQRN